MIQRLAQRCRHVFRTGLAAFQLPYCGGQIGAYAIVHVAQHPFPLGRSSACTFHQRHSIKRIAQLAFLLLNA
jgi:hypothetical protein